MPVHYTLLAGFEHFFTYERVKSCRSGAIFERFAPPPSVDARLMRLLQTYPTPPCTYRRPAMAATAGIRPCTVAVTACMVIATVWEGWAAWAWEAWSSSFHGYTASTNSPHLLVILQRWVCGASKPRLVPVCGDSESVSSARVVK